MMAVVDATALDHQEKAVLVLGQDVDRLGRHLGDRRLAALVAGAIGLVVHMRALEQAEQARRGLAVDRVELSLVPDIGTAVGIAAPATFLGQGRARPCGCRCGRRPPGRHGRRQEAVVAAAERDLEPVALRVADELRGDVLAAGGDIGSLHVGVAFPVAMRRKGMPSPPASRG